MTVRPVNTDGKQARVRGRFAKGCSGNPGGKPAGAGNTVPTLLKEMVLQALDNAGGVDYLRRMAEKQPAAFLGLLGKILPTQLTGEGGGPIGLDVMTPEQRAAEAERRQAAARAMIAEAFREDGNKIEAAVRGIE